MPVYVSIYCALISPSLVFTNPCSSMVWNCMQNMYATLMGANDKISFTLIRVLCKNHFRAWPSIKTIYVGNPPPQIIWTCNDHLEVISSGDIRWAIIKLICQWLRLFQKDPNTDQHTRQHKSLEVGEGVWDVLGNRPFIKPACRKVLGPKGAQSRAFWCGLSLSQWPPK